MGFFVFPIYDVFLFIITIYNSVVSRNNTSELAWRSEMEKEETLEENS